MASTAQAAIDLLNQNKSAYTDPEALKAYLKELASGVSVHAEGSVTVLYSGRFDAGNDVGVGADGIVKAMVANGDNVRVLNNTQFYQFVEHPDFRLAVAEALTLVQGLHYLTLRFYSALRCFK
ncbi:MAG: hypothetical protein OEZ43_07425 [Gammaproteobacteria bacterium]|nr:hypothetical protein [Gammaproteobacteria bacterium]